MWAYTFAMYPFSMSQNICNTQTIASVLRLLRMCLFEPGHLACRAALATGDFEAAAEHVSKYLQLDKQFSDVTDELDSHQLQEQRAVWPWCPTMRTERLCPVHTERDVQSGHLSHAPPLMHQRGKGRHASIPNSSASTAGQVVTLELHQLGSQRRLWCTGMARAPAGAAGGEGAAAD